ncbi:hypothetical protein D3C80_1353180 [compost metagenome]
MHVRQAAIELHAVHGATDFLAGVDLADLLPERPADLVIAARQQRHVVHQLVGMVVLGRHATGARLQAHVDVLADQHHLDIRATTLQLHQLVDDLVVVEVFRQAAEGSVQPAHEDRQATARFALATLDRHALLDLLRVGLAEQLVDQADRLATLGRHAVLAGLQMIELLEHGHRNGHVVFLEIQQGIRIVNQDIGIEHIQPGMRGSTGTFIHGRSPQSCRSCDGMPAGAPPPRSPSRRIATLRGDQSPT